MNKVALVTGASSGIGEATVKRLLADGYTVHAAARRLERMKVLEAAGAKLLPLDLTQDESIVAAMAALGREAGRIDLLVNNAGYGSYGAIEDVPIEEARRQIEVNLIGLARMCQLALPMMRAQGSGTIVNVTSIGGKLATAFGGWYHATKFAVEGLSDALRMETRPFGINVVLVEPGAIRTEWGGIAHDSLIARSGDGAYGPYARRIGKSFEGMEKSRLPSPPEVVANGIARIAAKRRPRARYAIGGGAKLFLTVRKLLPDRAFDALLWRMSGAAG